MSSDGTDPIERLMELFRGLIDEALIYAIANDHNLHNPFQFRLARDTLSGIADTVVIDEATGFNPSGLSDLPDEDEASNNAVSQSAGSTSQPPSLLQVTDSSNTDASSEGSYTVPRLTAFNAESEDAKVLYLRGMFAELKEYDITYALKQAKGDFQGALDHLLNEQYLQSTGQQARGIEAFLDDGEDSQHHKGSRKSRRKAKLNPKKTNVGFEPPSKAPEKEIKHQDEIAFIADRINIPYSEVSDIYYRKKHSSGAAIVVILDQHISLGIQTEDEDGKKQAQQLVAYHRNVPEKYMATLVQLTGSNHEFSSDVATLLSKHFTKNPWTQKLELTHRLTPLPDEHLDAALSPALVKASLKGNTPVASATPSPTFSPPEYSQAMKRVAESSHARREVESYASQLHRRGASNPLYRQAAAVYSDQARQHARTVAAAVSTAADAFVNQQSTSNSVDLHGVYVRDGVRIARQRVLAWWHGLGEGKSRRAREEGGFTVITGLGRHSAGGVSQLRQAVAAALLQDGWKMRVETGRFVVTGRR